MSELLRQIIISQTCRVCNYFVHEKGKMIIYFSSVYYKKRRQTSKVILTKICKKIKTSIKSIFYSSRLEFFYELDELQQTQFNCYFMWRGSSRPIIKLSLTYDICHWIFFKLRWREKKLKDHRHRINANWRKIKLAHLLLIFLGAYKSWSTYRSWNALLNNII
jgi:hypothetical protein